jgi:hypothetical protein
VTAEEFLALLTQHGISVLVDVRSAPTPPTSSQEQRLALTLTLILENY